MIEAEWLACTDPRLMKAVFQLASLRKQRLCFSACGRSVWHLLEPSARLAIEAGEQLADGLAIDAELDSLRGQLFETRHAGRGCEQASADVAVRVLDLNSSVYGLDWLIDAVATLLSTHAMKEAILHGRKNVPADRNAKLRDDLAHLFRDVLGNPFRTITLDPSWISSTVVAIAKQTYESRDFSAAMPILADALQEAGCDNEDVLNHCRDASMTHARGCWLVDLVLGKK
jgi:hypothetical protein